jgi:hypothetical protein
MLTEGGKCLGRVDKDELSEDGLEFFERRKRVREILDQSIHMSRNLEGLPDCQTSLD